MSNALETIRDDIYSIRADFETMAGDGINFDKEAGFAVQIISGNDYALKVAMGNRQSVVNAVTNVAAIGISLNPAKRQAYIVPRDGKICLDISYMGLLDLAIQSGSILWGQSEVVYSADSFELNGFDNPPAHKRDPFSKDRGEIIGAYVVVKTKDGDYLTGAMSIAEIFDIRNRSTAWKSYLAKQTKCPWVTDEGEMIKKTVIKRAYKLWPKTERLDAAIHHLNTDNDEGLEVLAPVEDTPMFDVSEALEAVEHAATVADLEAIWKDRGAKAVKAKAKGGHAALKQAVIERKAALEAPEPEDA